MTIHHIKIKDLNDQFLQKLKESYSEEDEITLWLKPKIVPTSSSKFSEKQFWQLINLLDWEKTGDNKAVIEPLVNELSTFSIEAIQHFEDILSEKLYHLDGEIFAQNIGERAFKEDEYFSTDTFLYARCCVVANGKEFYDYVIETPQEMPKNLTFSPLLRVASEAYFKKTGKRFQYTPKFIYETYANSKGWKNRNLLEQIIYN